MMQLRNKAIAVLLGLVLLGLSVSGVRATAARPPDETVPLFLPDRSGDYLCVPRITLRSPQLCPSFSPGARQVRLDYLRSHLPNPLPELPVEEVEPPDDGKISNYTYAYIVKLPAPTYAHPAEAEVGMPPKRLFEDGFNWFSVEGKVEYNGQIWYQVNEDEYIQADYVAIIGPSHFHGVLLSEQPRYPFAWVVRQTQASSSPGGKPDGPLLRRYEMVTLYGQIDVGDSWWYMIGPDQWIAQDTVGRVDVDPPPEGVAPGEKWIEVDTFEQTLAAYEGERMVFATLVSSGKGRKNWTPDGLHRIWAKLPTTPMSTPDSGPDKPDWYYLEDVEWTQYFFDDYALHAAYWHDAFGFVHSHGCVNLSPLDAKWLFQWTSPPVPEGAKVIYSDDAHPGTWVWVHHSHPIPGILP